MSKRPSLANHDNWLKKIDETLFGSKGQKGLCELLFGNGKPGLLEDVIAIKIQNKIIMGMLVATIIAVLGQYFA